MCRIDIAEQYIGLGNGGYTATLVIAHGAGQGARAFGTNLQRATPVYPDMRATPRTHFGKINRRNLEQIARAREKPRADHDARANRVLVRARYLTILDHRG